MLSRGSDSNIIKNSFCTYHKTVLYILSSGLSEFIISLVHPLKIDVKWSHTHTVRLRKEVTVHIKLSSQNSLLHVCTRKKTPFSYSQRLHNIPVTKSQTFKSLKKWIARSVKILSIISGWTSAQRKTFIITSDASIRTSRNCFDTFAVSETTCSNICSSGCVVGAHTHLWTYRQVCEASSKELMNMKRYRYTCKQLSLLISLNRLKNGWYTTV